MSRKSPQITALLQQWAEGDLDALDELMPLVFDDLHRMARAFFQRESEGHTLQATALISELYFLLRKQRKLSWANRRAFFGFASSVMQHFLIDYARKQKTQKRGGGLDHIGLDQVAELVGRENSVDLIVDLRSALADLRELDSDQADVVELRFLLGLQVEEVAEVLECSQPTVKRKWSSAKLWLIKRLTTPTSGDEETDEPVGSE